MLKRGNSRVKEALQWVISHFLSLVYSTGRDKKILISETLILGREGGVAKI